MSDAQKKPEVRHVKKFMGGRMTPDEVHRALGLRVRCLCGQPAAIRIKVLAPLQEVQDRNPQFVAMVAASNPDGPFVPTIPSKYGNLVKLSDVGACDNCKTEAERVAAKHPSWCIVEIDRGPGKDKPFGQVPINSPTIFGPHNKKS